MNIDFFAHFVYLVFFLAVGLIVVSVTEARDSKEPYMPEIIEVEQPHAWCYVLKNDQNNLVGDIHIMSCVPKGESDRNPDVLSLEESDSD